MPDGAGFLVAEPVLPASLRALGGFEMIRAQIRQVHEAFRLVSARLDD